MAMAPRAAGRVGHVSHSARAAARLSGGLSGAGNRGARLAELIARIEANASAPTPAPIAYGSMTVRDLRDAASKSGVAHEAIEQACDGEDPRAELIALITSQTRSAQGP